METQNRSVAGIRVKRLNQKSRDQSRQSPIHADSTCVREDG